MQTKPSDLGRRFASWVWRTPGARAVVLANLVPLIGALVFAWDAFTIVFLYWLENVVIGGFNVVKVVFARGGYASYGEMYRRYPQFVILLPILLAFFVFHYGGFCYGHGIFVFALFDKALDTRGDLLTWVEAELTLGVILALAALVVEHAYSLYADFWKRGDYARTSPVWYFIAPYGRIVLVHVVLLGGGFLAYIMSAPPAMMVLLIALKVGPELLAVEISESRRAQADGKSLLAWGKATINVPATVQEWSANETVFREVEAQPAESRVVVERDADNITLRVPPAGLFRRSHAAQFVMGLFLLVTTIVVTAGFTAAWFARVRGYQSIWPVFLILPLFWLLSLSVLLTAINMGRRRGVLAIVGDTLMVKQTGMFGGKRGEWQRNEIADVRTGPTSSTIKTPYVWELQIHPRTGPKFGLLAGHGPAELAWMATVLRRALNKEPLTDAGARR